MSKVKTVQKTLFMWHSTSKGYQPSQKSAGSLKTGSFCHFLILFHILMQKDCR